MKRISRSKLQRRPRPAGVELGVVGVAVGAGCGMLGGLMIEFNSRPSALVMFVGALIGMTGGGLVELVRFLGRKHAHRKIAHRDATAGQVPAPRSLSTAPPS